MLELILSFKRVYLTGQRHLIEALRAFGLTPARLDVMRLILEGIGTQQALRRELGVARSTISRMVTAMEQRGLIVRTSKAPQRATKYVALAPGLAERVREAIGLLHWASAAAVADAFNIGPHSFRKFFNLLTGLELDLQTVRVRWGDRSRRWEAPFIQHFDH